jgi:hypothetical protein
LASPQPGSSAADANSGLTGLYYSGIFGTAFIDNANNLISSNLFSSLQLTGTNWTLGADANTYSGFTNPVTGNGSFVSKLSLNGTYARRLDPSATNSIDLTYLDANALAVSQSAVAGSWTLGPSAGFPNQLSITIDAAGNLNGSVTSQFPAGGTSLGNCSLSGSVTHKEPSTFRNMYSFSMSASGVDCGLDKNSAYTGLAGITLTPAGIYVSNGVFRTLAFSAKTTTGSTFRGVFKKP